MVQTKELFKVTRPAYVYQSVSDLWVITSFFNAQNYSSKYKNYQLFAESLENSGINYLVVECAFDEQPHTLPDSPNILKVRSKSILWQKERLLNIAIASLPAECVKVAWVDCDVFFENEFWAVETSKLLNEYKVVQPFDRVIRLPNGVLSYKGSGEIYESFAAVHQKSLFTLPAGDFSIHGHTGFAWAMRKDILLQFGLYDPCLSGSSDHLMTHAFCGDFTSACIEQMLGANPFTHKHFYEWAKGIYPVVSGRIGCVKGTLNHLWHGDTANKQYLRRNQEIAQLLFNPYQDLIINQNGCWEWSDIGLLKTGLQEWAVRFYESRKEDG
ncbi:hypothetical protein ACFGVR_15560 [Mucilaginibacter sp. AW1-3]